MQKASYLVFTIRAFTLQAFTIIGLISPMIVFADELSAASNANLARNIHIRSLAASCAACHGTNGNSSAVGGSANTVSLAGRDRTDFITKIQSFKSGERVATVMHRHAKGLSAQEIADLADYFSRQTPSKPDFLPSQKLSETYAN